MKNINYIIHILLLAFVFSTLSCHNKKNKKTGLSIDLETEVLSDTLATSHLTKYKDSVVFTSESISVKEPLKQTTKQFNPIFYLTKNKNGQEVNKSCQEAIFEIDIPDNISDNQKVYLEYQLFGVSDYTNIVRRINEGEVNTGKFVKKSDEWNFQREEILPSSLKKGLNTIRFQAFKGYEGNFIVKDLQLKIVPFELKENHELIINQPETRYYYGEYGYLEGFLKGGGVNDAEVKINGKKITLKNGKFQSLVRKPEGQSGEWVAHVEAIFSDGRKLESQHRYVSSVGYDFKTADQYEPSYAEVAVSADTPFRLEIPGASLIGGTNSVKKSIKLTVTALRSIDMALVKSNMTNVTGTDDGYRFLPDGTKFEKEVVLALQYDSTKVPKGYRVNDIYTYYYNEEDKRWIALQRDSIDIANQIVYSRTNHFTDYINGIIKVPETSEVSAYIPTSISGLQAADPSSGISLISTPTPNNKGTASLIYPIIIPSGRQGMMPQLSLVYNSSGGNGWIGQGWDIPISSIEVETRWGVPWFDPEYDSEVYLLDGETLVNFGVDINGNDSLAKPAYHRDWDKRNTSGTKQFYRRVEGVFQKIIRHGTKPSTYYWEVIDKDGTCYYYGKSHQQNTLDRNFALCDSRGDIPKWYLSMVKDVHGNVIFYSYQHKKGDKGENRFISNINYTGFNFEKGKYNIDFYVSKEDRPDQAINARKGFKELNAWLLDRVEIKYNSEFIGAYYFGYKQGDYGKTLLDCVIQVDSLFKATDVQCGSNSILSKNVFNRSNDYGCSNRTPLLKHKFAYHELKKGVVSYKSDTVINVHNDKSTYKHHFVKFSGHDVGELGVNISKGWDAGGALNIGFDYIPVLNTVAAGGNYTYFDQESEGVVTYIDLNGDGYPDKLFKKNSDNGLYYRLQEIDEGGNSLGFSATARLIRGVTDFNASVGTTESYGPEVNAAVVKLGITWDNSKTTTEAYYADVNGDGLIDFIDNRGKDSKIFINKLDDNGLPVFSNKAEADTIWVTGDCGPEPIYNMGEVDETIYDPEEMWGDVETDSCYTKCVAPALPCCSICTVLGAGHPDCANYHTCGQRCNANCGGCEVTKDTCIKTTKKVLLWSYQPPTIYTPDIQTVRCWVAPYNGTINISGTAALTLCDQEDRKLYQLDDGVRVSIQKSGNNYSFITQHITPDNSIKSMNLTNISVTAGDRIYFRMEPLKKRTLDKIIWNPKIEYTAASHPGNNESYNDRLQTKNFNGEDNFRFNASDDFIVSGRFEYLPMNFNGRIKIAVDLQSEALKDDIVVVLTRTRSGVTSTIHMITFPKNTPINYTTSNFYEMEVNMSDSIALRMNTVGVGLPLSLFKASAVKKAFAQVTYIDNYDGFPILDDSDPNNVKYALKYEVPIFSLSLPAPLQPSLLQEYSGTVRIKPGAAMKSGVTSSLNILYMVVRNENGTILGTHQYFLARDGKCSGDPVQVTLNGRSYIDCYLLANNGDAQLVQSMWISMYDNKDKLISDKEFYCGLYAFHAPDIQKFGHLYRGWGEFGYKPVDPSLTYIEEQLLNLDLIKNMNEEDLDKINIDDNVCREDKVEGGYNPLSGNFFMMDPNYKRQCYLGYGNVFYITADTLSNDLFWGTETSIKSSGHPVPRIVERPKAKVVNKAVFTDSRSFYGEAGLSFLSVGGSGTDGMTRTYSDFLDLNGDGYPEPLSDIKMQYTRPQGGLSSRIGVHFAGDQFVDESMFDAFSKSVSASMIVAEKKPANSPRKTGVSVSGGTGESNSKDINNYNWMDINGDGLPDKISKNGNVNLNLGYTMDNALHFGSITPRIGKSNCISISGGLGFSLDHADVAYGSISGGLGGTESTNKIEEILLDINADGLPDKLIVKENAVYVSFNTGSGFLGEQVLLSGYDISRDVSYGFRAYGAITAGGVLGFIPVKITGSPRGSKSWGIHSIEVQFMDMNNDGYPDIVIKHGDGKIKVKYAEPTAENLLKRVETSINKEIYIDYQLTSRSTSSSPYRNWEMKSVKEKGRLDASIVQFTQTEYEYRNRKYSRYEREDYGYEFVITKQYNSEDPSAQDIYLARIIEEQYHNSSYLLKGLPVKRTVKNGGGSIFSETAYNYQPADIKSGKFITNFCLGSAYPALMSDTVKYYEFTGSPQIRQQKSYTYGSYANVISYTNNGDLNDRNDNISAEMTYFTNLQKYIVNKIERITYAASSCTPRIQETVIEPNTGNVLTVKNQQEQQYDYSYDTYGNISSVTHPANGHGQRMKINYTYDPILHSLPVTVTNIQRYSSSVSYNYKWGVPVVTTDIGGAQIYYTYDAKGRIKSIRSPQDPNYTIKYNYWDQSARGFSRWDYIWVHTSHYNPDFYNSIDNPIDITTHMDGFGRIYSISKDIEYRGSLCRNISGICLYDALGRVIKQYDTFLPTDHNGIPYIPDIYYFVYPQRIPSHNAYTTYAYDDFDRVTRIKYPDGSQEDKYYDISSDAFGTTRFVSTHINALGNPTYIYTDVRGLQTSISSPSDATTTFIYDGLSRLLESTDPENYTTRYFYDHLGRLSFVAHPSRGERWFEYDGASSNISGEINPLGRINYEYDYNRPVAVQYDNRPENNVYMEYGEPNSGYGSGRIIKQEDANSVQKFEYGPLGEVIGITKTQFLPFGGLVTYSTEWEYDSWNRIRQIIYPDGEAVKYDYNFGGRLKTVTGYTHNGYLKTYINNIEYDEKERKYIVNTPYTSTQYNYDVMGRLEEKEIHGNNNVYTRETYEYDPIGNITKKQQERLVNNHYLANFTSNLSGDFYYTYDEDNRLMHSNITSTIGGYQSEIAMSYSPTGRILSKIEASDRIQRFNDDHIHTQMPPATYLYDHPANPYALSAIRTPYGDCIFDWDKSGNMRFKDKEGMLNYYYWTTDNRLEAFDSDEQVAFYGYDASGERSYKLTGIKMDLWQNGEMFRVPVYDKATMYAGSLMTISSNRGYTKHYFMEGDRIASSIGGGGIPLVDPDNNSLTPFDMSVSEKLEMIDAVVSDYYNNTPHENKNPDEVCGRSEYNGGYLADMYKYYLGLNSPDVTYYFHADHLGGASMITDEDGDAYQYLGYMPFGEVLYDIRVGDEGATPHQFTGKEKDEETGLNYFINRYYDPELGIFISVDPMFHKYPGISAYVYCANNPVKYIDPDGRKIVLAGSSEFKKTTFNDIQKLSSNNLVMLKNGTVVESSKYKGDRAAIALSGIGSGNKEYGTKMIGDLVSNTKHTVTIQQTGDENNSFLPASNAHARTSGVGSGGTLSYDPETTGYNIVNQDGTTRAPAFISLGHELIHADKAMKGKTLDVNDNNGKTDPDLLPMVHQKRSPEEIDTRVKENILRKENNVKPRAIPD